MHETNGDNVPGDKISDTDPLAEIVRAAGRRPAPPQAHYDQVFAAAHSTWRRRIKRRRQQRWFAAAAAIGLFAIAGALWQSFQTSSPSLTAEILLANGTVQWLAPETGLWAEINEGSLRNGTRLRTGADGATSLRLINGGSLRLSSHTEIVLNGDSFVLNEGMLYFDSAGRRPAMAVDVITPYGTIRDVGTQFEVRTDRDLLRVRVRSGSVALLDSPIIGSVSGASGEELRLSAAGELSRIEFASDDPEWAWAESLAVVPNFDTPYVMRYLQWIAEETGKQLDFETEDVRLRAETARFLGDPQGLLPTELLVTIAATSDFSFEMTDSGTIVISRDD